MPKNLYYGAEGVCEVCWEKPAVFKCLKCGRRVCEDHLGPGGMCTICRSMLCDICRESLAVATCISCGRIVCYRCLDRRYNELVCMLCRIGIGGSATRLVGVVKSRRGSKL